MIQLKSFLFSLLLLVCPLALCYGQLSFSGVNGEQGYSALRGSYRWDTDTDLILTPSVGYYRMSDDDNEDVAGAITRYFLLGEYLLSDQWTVGAGASLIPVRLGFANVGYEGRARYTFCYRCGIFKNPYIGGRLAQTRYRIANDVDGQSLPQKFTTTQNDAAMAVGAEIGRLNLRLEYDKVISYSSTPPDNVASLWADIPFMTAVVQGFVRDVAAMRVSYKTPCVTPYAVYTRYRYTQQSEYTVSVAAGLQLNIGDVSFSGGVEIFEQNRDESRKTYFSISAEQEF